MAIRHNFERGPSKDHSSKVWSKLAQWFLRRRLKCEKLTTDERQKKPDGKNSHGLWPGELKTLSIRFSVKICPTMATILEGVNNVSYKTIHNKHLLYIMVTIRFSFNLMLTAAQKTRFDESRQKFQVHITLWVR